MTLQQCEQAIAQGQDVVRALPGNTVLLGEMGIGNTSSATLLMARLLGEPLLAFAGRGAGLDDAAYQRKVDILREVLSRHVDAVFPMATLMAFGGLQAAGAGFAALRFCTPV